MKKVELKSMEQTKYEIIKELVDHNGNKVRAALKLNITIRQVNRLIVIYKTKGKEGFIHGNHNRKPKHTIDEDIKLKIIELYQNKYKQFNFKHFTEKLKSLENINVSYSVVRSLLVSNHILSPKTHRITVYREKEFIKLAKKNNLTEAQKELVICNNILDKYDAHSRVPRMKYFGECLEMDASKDYWFGDTKTTLHGAIDNATGQVVGLFFDKEETLFGYYSLFSIILREYGAPAQFLTDNRTVFIYNGLNRKSLEKDTLTQFGYACKSLGVDLKTTSIPEKKSRIERLWGSLQSRLVSELRLANIKTIEDANSFLVSFTKNYNKQFALPINYTTSVFEKIDINNINQILSIISLRKFDRGCSISYKNKHYLAYKHNHQMNYVKGTECMVIETFDHKLYCNVNDDLSELIEIEDFQEYSKDFDIPCVKVKKEKGKYIPPMTHPFKQESYLKYLVSNKRTENYSFE
ncbi:MAG: ISNCY family transposase [Clostridia bacterium]|nr:ISNCY family transposase [Clostridia bacterium]